MANVDNHGNKFPQFKLKKSVKSADERRQVAGKQNRCACGFHRRGLNHNNGNHHRSWWNNLSDTQKMKYRMIAPTC